jgi:hypothetical protein
MNENSFRHLRDEMLAASDDLDELHFPPRFRETRIALRAAIARMEADGIPNETLVAVMMSETIPRMVEERGPGWVATMLAKLAQSIGSAVPPSCLRQ